MTLRMGLVWLRFREGIGQRRETHVAPGDAGKRITALCGQPFAWWQVERVAVLGELPCVQCQLLSPEPDWAALERVPYPPRLPFSSSGA